MPDLFMTTSEFDALQAIAKRARVNRVVVRDNPLTEGEFQILEEVIEGSTNPEIAEKFHISESTVKYHMRNILRKCRTRTRAGAVTVAFRNKWVN
jgi:DNA-binding NarL/FixJ family response regulator